MKLIAAMMIAWTGAALSVQGADFLPVEESTWEQLRPEVRTWSTALKKVSSALPEKSLALLKKAKSVEEVEALLDPHCLLGIHINPESRVKTRRGPAAAELEKDEPKWFLVKVHNQGGVRAPVAVHGDELIGKEAKAGQWAEAEARLISPKREGLTGLPLEYVLLRLTAREAGKREATLKLDVGQGTQDLGFRAEVPILFRIKQASPPR